MPTRSVAPPALVYLLVQSWTRDGVLSQGLGETVLAFHETETSKSS